MQLPNVGDEAAAIPSPRPDGPLEPLASSRSGRFLAVALGLYLLLLFAIVAGLYRVRGLAETEFSTTASQDAWDAWRQEASQQDGARHPVSRRIPRSEEPPMRRLLRDHFGVCLASGVILTSALYWTVALLGRGVARGPAFQIDLADPSPEIRR